jgi:membrane associated rhomboid family serine protease
MFPLRDTVRSRSMPMVTWGLIAVNLLIFLFESSLSQSGFARLLSTYGLVPVRLSLASPLSVLTLISSAFLHGSWFHVIFGDNVEDRMGHRRYLSFYLLAAVAAGLVQVFILPGSAVPTVGASGAIAGVLGAYMLLFPTARIKTLVMLVIIPWFVDIPAVIFIGIWFLTQLSSGLVSLGALGGGVSFSGIAWWAHVGGFAFGVLAGRILARPARLPTYWPPQGPPAW